MRIAFALKTLLTPLLTLLLLAGCVAPTATPLSVPSDKTSAVTISVAVPKSGYQAQHLTSDIKTLVFGLVDVAPDDAYFGFVNTGTTNAVLPETGSPFHRAIAGNGNSGSGLLTGDGLTSSQWAQTKRYLYAVAPDTSKLSMTFTGVRESSTPRYVAFVAAFGKDAATLTSADLLGFTRSTTPFSIVNGTPSLPLDLTLTLDEGLVDLTVHVNFTGTLTHPVSSTSRVIVALADMDANRDPRFGYHGSSTLQPDFHPLIAGTWAGTTFTRGFFDYPFAFPEQIGMKGEFNRFIYAEIPTGPTAANGERTVRFSNIRPGGTYSLFSVALDSTDSMVGQADQLDGITLQAGTNPSQNLELPLDQ